MMSKELTTIEKTGDWYGALLEELRATWVEQNFTISWTIIERNHKLGEVVRRATDDQKVPISDLIMQVAEDMKCSERLLWQCVQCYDKFPDINKIPDGKAANWSKIRLLLGDQKQPAAPSFSPDVIATKLFQKYGPEQSKEILQHLAMLCDPLAGPSSIES